MDGWMAGSLSGCTDPMEYLYLFDLILIYLEWWNIFWLIWSDLLYWLNIYIFLIYSEFICILIWFTWIGMTDLYYYLKWYDCISDLLDFISLLEYILYLVAIDLIYLEYILFTWNWSTRNLFPANKNDITVPPHLNANLTLILTELYPDSNLKANRRSVGDGGRVDRNHTFLYSDLLGMVWLYRLLYFLIYLEFTVLMEWNVIFFWFISC
jgi:hypothetical protein